MHAWLEAFLDEAEKAGGAIARETAHRIIEGAEGLGLDPKRQAPHPDKGGAVAFVIRGISTWPDATPVILLARGRVAWQVAELRHHNPFRIAAMEQQLRERIAVFPTTALHKPDWPDTQISDLATDEGLREFLETLGWVVERIRNTNPN